MAAILDVRKSQMAAILDVRKSQMAAILDVRKSWMAAICEDYPIITSNGEEDSDSNIPPHPNSTYFKWLFDRVINIPFQ